MQSPDFGLNDNASLSPMRGIISEYSDGNPRISFALVDSAGTPLRAYAAERVYYSASTVKLGVMVATLRHIQRGIWALSDEWLVSHEFASIVPGAQRFTIPLDETDPGCGTPGDTVTLGHLLDRMTSVSANCATNRLFEALGVEAVSAAFGDAGIYDTGMDRPYSDVSGLQAGITNRATALGLARFMAAITGGQLLDVAHTNAAVAYMRKCEEPLIGAVLAERAARSGIRLDHGSKGGTVEGIVHEVAFVERNGERLCLAICTRGYSEAQGSVAIRAIADAVLGNWATAQ